MPKGLELVHIREAVDFVEKECGELVELYYEQANVFSAIVGIFGTKALASVSPYKKHKHPDVAQERFPDLSLGGRTNPPPEVALESKGSKRPWELQAHYDHPGWYIVWRYVIDQTKQMRPGREVVIWRVDVVFIRKEDWKYEKSTAGDHGGGRTQTFGLRRAKEKLTGCAAYSLRNVILRGRVPVLVNGGQHRPCRLLDDPLSDC